MKKKLLCFLGAAALALALSACSNNKSTSEAASEGASDVAQSSAATDTGAKKHMNTATFGSEAILIRLTAGMHGHFQERL